MRIEEILEIIMPLGGWTVSDGIVSIKEDGKSHGYSVPTEEEIEKAKVQLTKVKRASGIVKKLTELDEKLRRDVEELTNAQGITLSPYLEGIKTRKKELRDELQSL